MFKFGSACIGLLLFLGCCAPDKPAATTRSASIEATPLTSQPTRPVAAIWYESSGERNDDEGIMALIVGIWSDGTVIWSGQRDIGGKPYRKARVDPGRVQALFVQLESDDLFSNMRQVNFGPDASYTVIAAENGERRQWLGSWHDPSPGSGVVITDRGMGTANSGLPPPSSEYVHFLEVWKNSGSHIESLVPSAGEPASSFDQSIFRLGRGL